MSVISLRVPKQLREKMKQLPIVWGRELRDYIERRIVEEERKKALDRIVALISALPPAERGFAVKSVREDRDR